VPSKTGFSCLTPLLGVRGGIAGDFTITMLSEDDYMMFGSGMAERYHQRYFTSVPKPDSVQFVSKTKDMVGFNIAGPKSRALLERLTDADLSNKNWRFMRSKKIRIAGLSVLALRVSFTGDLGWELYADQSDQLALYKALLKAGKDLGVTPIGSRSLLSLRVEKGYGSWGREYSPEFWPHETGLERLIKLDKPEFLGRAAYLKIKDKTPRYRLVMFEVEAGKADASGGEPIFLPDGTPVGYVSTGAYGHSVQKSLAMGFINHKSYKANGEYSIAILGRPHKARLLDSPPFDPEGQRLRA